MKKLAYSLLLTTTLACFSSHSFAQNSDKFTQIKTLAEQGNMDAQADLAFMYYTGKGTEKDLFKAIEWNEKAAKQGSVKA